MPIPEIWKPIDGFEGLYEISNLGNVKSLGRTIKLPMGRAERVFYPTILRPLTGSGYAHVHLQINGVIKYKKVHRLVGFAFIPNPNNYPFINHKDGNTLNNRVDNLEWCTRQMNSLHAHSMGLVRILKGIEHPNAKQIKNIETGEIYESVIQASKCIGVGFSTVSAYINNNKNRLISKSLKEKLSKLVVHSF